MTHYYDEGPVQESPPDADAPIPEGAVSPNVPYRGVVDHGVHTDDISPNDESHYYEGKPVVYEDPVQLPDPVPVYVTRAPDGSQEIRTFNVGQFPLAAGQTIALVGRDKHRTKIFIQCVTGSTGPLFIGGIDVSAANGFQIPVGGTSQEINAQEPIYVTTPLGCTVSWFAEYVKEYKS